LLPIEEAAEGNDSWLTAEVVKDPTVVPVSVVAADHTKETANDPSSIGPSAGTVLMQERAQDAFDVPVAAGPLVTTAEDSLAVGASLTANPMADTAVAKDNQSTTLGTKTYFNVRT
jgi:hypothetical protein